MFWHLTCIIGIISGPNYPQNLKRLKQYFAFCWLTNALEALWSSGLCTLEYCLHFGNKKCNDHNQGPPHPTLWNFSKSFCWQPNKCSLDSTSSISPFPSLPLLPLHCACNVDETQGMWYVSKTFLHLWPLLLLCNTASTWNPPGTTSLVSTLIHPALESILTILSRFSPLLSPLLMFPLYPMLPLSPVHHLEWVANPWVSYLL